MIEATGEDSYILRYDASPAWMPTSVRSLDAQDSVKVELRRKFIEQKCKEWK